MAFDYIDYSKLEGKTDLDKIARLSLLEPNLLERINSASKSYYERTGKKLPINSAYRTNEDQAVLTSNQASNPYPVAAPGRSAHQRGSAIDISPGPWDQDLVQNKLNRSKGDIVHVMAAPENNQDWFENPTPYSEPTAKTGTQQSVAPATSGDWFENPMPYSASPQSFQTAFENKKEARGKLVEKFATKFAPNLIPEETKPIIKDLGKNVASFLDNTIGGVLPYGAKQIGYVFGRTIGDSPETADKISARMASIVDKPFGKAFGISDDPVYKGEATGKLMQFIGENVGKGAGYISEKTGLPKSDIEWMINTALPKVTEIVAKPVVQSVAKAEIGATGAVKSEFNKLKAETEAKLGGQELQKQFAKKQGIAPVEAKNAPSEGPATFEEFVNEAAKDGHDVTSPEAVETLQRIWAEHGGAPGNQPAPKATVEVSGYPEPIKEATINGEPTQIHITPEEPAMPTSKLSAEEMANREQALKDIGQTSFRHSAIENNPKEAATQYITGKAEQGIYGEGMTEQINHEKTALNNHFSTIEKEAGGIVPGEKAVKDKIAAGKVIKDQLEQAKNDHNADTKTLYKEAEQQHGGKPVALTDFADYLKDDSNFIKGEQQNFQKVVNAELKRRGYLNENGDLKPLTVKEAEGMRQFLNEKYDYEWGNQAVGLKKAIDSDVFRDVQGETYQKARAHFGEGKEMFENPKAMRDLLADEGVNQKIADEQVMQKIAKLPESQFAHLYSTLGEKGKTVAQDQIRTSLINEVKQAGQSARGEPWNQPAASKRYAELQEKFDVAFADKPELLEKVHKGLLAGDINHIPTKYEGAAVQAHKLHGKFSEFYTTGGAGAGAAIGGIFGGIPAAAGSMAGGALGKVAQSAANRRAQRQSLEKEIKSDNKTSLQDMYSIKEK
jgi:hypothetical protein